MAEAPAKDSQDTPPVGETEGAPDQSTTYVGAATNVASSAATTAASTAQGVKDSVFSMFGGGAKKPEKKDEETEEGEAQDRSGSAKAAKDAKAAEEGEEGDEKAVSLFSSSTLNLTGRHHGPERVVSWYLYHFAGVQRRRSRSQCPENCWCSRTVLTD